MVTQSTSKSTPPQHANYTRQCAQLMPNEQATYAGLHKRRIIGKPELVCEIGQLGILMEVDLEVLLH